MNSERDKIRQKLGYDRISMLSVQDWDRETEQRSVLADATFAVARLGADILRPLLASENRVISSRAPCIFSELGKHGEPVIADVLNCLDHPFKTARWDALEGLIYYGSRLTPEQVARVIVLAADSESLVRQKAIEFISAVSVSNVEAAQNFLTPDDRVAEHKKGLACLKNIVPREEAMEILTENEIVTSCYVYASFLDAAKAGEFVEIPEEKIRSKEANYVRGKLALRKKHRARRGSVED